MCNYGEDKVQLYHEVHLFTFYMNQFLQRFTTYSLSPPVLYFNFQWKMLSNVTNHWLLLVELMKYVRWSSKIRIILQNYVVV